MQSSSKRRHWRLMTTAASSVVLLWSAVGVAQAQDATAGEEDEIIVTGFRASLQNSIDTKRRSSSIVEAVSAEEIGKLPDNSIAESLARLPGLSAQRLFGRSQVISVRGLSPDFTTALLNGREQVSAGDNRGVEFDQYPSELLSSVVVYKTPDASLVGQGLAGTADMRTVRPLDYEERVLAFNARYEWNDIGALNPGTEDNGYRVTASYIDQTEDGRLGWAIGIASMSSPTQAERWEAWGYPELSPGVLVLGGAKPYVQSSVLERTGVMGVLQFQPSNTFSSTIDIFYSDFQEEQTLRGIELPFQWADGRVGTTLLPGFTVEDGLVTAGTWDNVEGVIRNDLRTRNSTVQAIGWNMEWQVGEQWSLESDLSYSSVERNDLDLEIYAGTGGGPGVGAQDTMTFEQQSGGGFIFGSVLDYADPSLILLTDPLGWGGFPGTGQTGFIKEPQTDDQLTSLRLTAEREFTNGPFSSMEFGINFSDREKNKDSIEAFVDLVGGNYNPVQVPSEYLLEPVSLEFLGIEGSLAFDPLRLLNESGLLTLRPLVNSDVVVKAWGVEERVTTAYTQLNVDSSIGPHALTGNVGVQLVHTDQQSSGGVMTSTGPQIVSNGDDYLEILPSLNLALELTDSQMLRLGIARTLARARMDDLRASFAVGYRTGNQAITDPANSYWSGNGGNPMLRPWIANSIDLSYEVYLGGAGYIAIAGFYKQLESYIYPENVLFDFTGFPLNSPGDTPATNLGVASVPQNGSGGYIQGLEFTASIPGELLFDALEGFGLLLNASSTDSDIQPPNTPASALPGLSETVINTTLYFERSGFEARVSNRYRSDFLGEVTGFGAGRELRMVNGESVVDAQIGYRFDDGPLDGLGLTFQANNITDEPFGTYNAGDERQVRDYQRYGQTFLFGVSYRR